MTNAFRTGLSLAVLCSTFGSASASQLQGQVRFPQGIDRSRSPAIVYVVGNELAQAPERDQVVVDQEDLQFVPRVQAVALGGSVIFRNSDAEAHNVNSQSGCCSFNYMVRPSDDSGPGVTVPIRPERPGLISLLCNIHQQMRGFVMVCPNRFFAVTDDDGGFLIAGLPDGNYKVHTWQEYSKPLVREVAVSGDTRVDFTLEAANSPKPGPSVVQPARVVPWSEVVQRVVATLEEAVVAAQEVGGGGRADQLAVDAYFEHFEAGDLETAIRMYRGEQSVFVLERKIASIRRPLLRNLAQGIERPEVVRQAIAELELALKEEVRLLDARGIRDRSVLTGESRSAVGDVSRVSREDLQQVMAELRSAFQAAAALANEGEMAGAGTVLADAYFQTFHRIEPALASRSLRQVQRIESDFLDLRGRIKSGIAAPDLEQQLNALWARIDLATAELERSAAPGWVGAVNGFWNAFVILTREGVEAILVISALLLYLDRLGRSAEKRIVLVGVLSGGVATVATWAALQWFIVRPGLAGELVEGLSALVAAAVLFYVSYWLLSRSEARHWQEFLTRQLGKGITSGSAWAIGAAAFLAIYREGAETILMFQPLLGNPHPKELTGVLAGVLGAVASLALIYVGLRQASVRLAIRPFFRVTGVLLFGLAVVFAGKGVTELQEVGVLAIRPLPPSLYTAVTAVPLGLRQAMGISPTVQSLSIQLTILTGALLSLGSMWIIGRVSSAEEQLPRIVEVKQSLAEQRNFRGK